MNDRLGVTDVGGTGGSAKLSAPLRFEVVETGERVDLAELSPPFGRFNVSTEATGEPVTLRIASNFTREGVAVTVPVASTLLVEVENDRPRALGMQTTRVTVRGLGANAPGTVVSIAAPDALLDQDRVTLDAQGLGHTVLRTDETGLITVRATATGFVSAQTPMNVVWPWATLAATCAGGLCGGFLRLAGAGGRRRPGRVVLSLGIAVVTGLVVFALQVVGVKVLPVTFTTAVGDLVAFATGAVGGWLGPKVLPEKGTAT
jgi:hypothetical protein